MVHGSLFDQLKIPIGYGLVVPTQRKPFKDHLIRTVTSVLVMKGLEVEK